MFAELGHFSLILGLCFSILLLVMPVYGVLTQNQAFITGARTLVTGQMTFVALSFIALAISFLLDDFSVLYVANHSSLKLPWFYKMCAVWGGHEGSMLLWATILTTWMFAVSLFSKNLEQRFFIYVLSVLAFISIGFFLFLLTTSDPFLRLLEQAPNNGGDLNPLLQDPGFLFHPPMLYMGYVGFAVAFAFAIASLIVGKVDTVWAKWARPWTLAAWCCLTAGITLGSWWAYRELGWGGWWFWDPVENASFMPWIVGTALIHSLAVTEKRKVFQAWTLFLALCAFSLSLLGTFLVRSGVLTSVHAFAVSPGRGLFMLCFLLVVIGASLLIYAFRANTVMNKANFSFLSREMMLMLNNVFLAVIMLTVLMGTLYPLIIDALDFGKISVGAPYFNQMFVILVSPLLFLMGIGPHCLWKNIGLDILMQRLRIIALLAIFLSLGLPASISNASVSITNLGIMLGLWIILSTFIDAYLKIKKTGSMALPLAIWGMLFAHFGVAVSTLGIAISTGYGIEADLRMSSGSSHQVGSYVFKMMGTKDIKGPNYQAVDAHFDVYKNKQKIATLHPEKRIYDVDKMAMTDSDIGVGIFRDLYIALGEPLPGDAWSVRIYIKPFIRWIWAGGFLILFGGLLAMSDKRYRQKVEA
jgi:cytochrome c-type biogenesis protein CcmF